MKSLIEQLDKPQNAPPQPITKIVEVNWMDADDLVAVLAKVFLPGSASADPKYSISGGNGSLITITKAAAAGKPVTDSGGKDSDKQIKTKLQGLEESVLGQFVPSYKNALVLTAPPVIMDEMVKMVKELDVPQQQVQIEARLVEMSENASRQLGSTLGLTGNGSITDLKSKNNFPELASGLSSTFGKNITIFGEAYDLAGTLQAYEKRQMLTVLANPRVVTLNKQQAAVSFVQQIPYSTYTITNETRTQTISFKDAGVDIGVLPTVSKTGNVHMAIGVTQAIHSGDVTDPETGSVVPIIDKRHVQGQVIANTGDTIVMGGLRTMKLNDKTNGTPWLHQVPVLGWLFKNKENAVEKVELFIFITPRVLDDVIATPEQKVQYDKIDTKWHMPDYFFDDVKTDVDKN
jgi:type II secretory pathway component GspD/PulD (secretin)